TPSSAGAACPARNSFEQYRETQMSDRLSGQNASGQPPPGGVGGLSPFATELGALPPRLRRYAMTLTRSASEADDLAQASCERALKAQAQFQEGTRLDAWLFSITRNLWIDALRKRQREGRVEEIDAHLDLPGDDGRQVN